MSPALSSLRVALDRAAGPAERAAARTSYAIYLARMGNVEQARSEILELRSTVQQGLQAECTARANLAEGVLLFCTGDWGTAMDKLYRADALSSLPRCTSVSNLANAWHAHILVNLGRSTEVPRFANLVMTRVEASEHAAIARLSLAIAVGLQSAESYELSRTWYEIARRHAVRDQDDLTIDAILSDAAAFRINNLKLAEIDSSVSPKELARARQELDSSIHYYRAKAWPSFQWILPLLHVQLLLLECSFQQALSESAAWLATCGGEAPERLRWVALADHAYCLARTGDLEGAARFECDSLDLAPSSLGDDERALATFRRAQLAEMRGDADAYRELMDQCLEAMAAHRRDQVAHAQALEALHPPPSFS